MTRLAPTATASAVTPSYCGVSGVSRGFRKGLRQALCASIFLGAAATPVLAQGILQMPAGSVQVTAEASAASQYLIPTGPWDGSGMPSFEAEGAYAREVWRVESYAAGTGVLLAVLSGQLEEAGFQPIFSCTDMICGGFDFRFALDVVPEPDMHVNLADYAFYAARRDGEEGPEYSALLISAGGGAGFVQSVHVAPQSAELAEVTLSTRSPAASAIPSLSSQDLTEALVTTGRVPLRGIEFAYGSADLSDPDAAVLENLAGFLAENPEIRLTLVGHTDAEGSLAANIAVSQARAESVRSVLIDGYGIAPDRLSAEGVGYLMPLALNTTQEGRDINRRVEAVVINTQ